MSKKFILITSFLFSVLIFGFFVVLPAGAFIYSKVSSYSAKYALTVDVAQEENVFTYLQFATTTESYAVLVDKSDTNMFPHYSSGNEIRVSKIEVNWEANPDAPTASTTLRFGLIASTSPSGAVADVWWFDQVSFSNADASQHFQRVVLDYSPSFVKLGTFSTSAASTTAFTSNVLSNSISNFATTSAILCPKKELDGTQLQCLPNVRDLVLWIYNQDGRATSSIKTFYHTK